MRSPPYLTSLDLLLPMDYFLSNTKSRPIRTSIFQPSRLPRYDPPGFPAPMPAELGFHGMLFFLFACRISR
jgi:hypothetical protein